MGMEQFGLTISPQDRGMSQRIRMRLGIFAVARLLYAQRVSVDKT